MTTCSAISIREVFISRLDKFFSTAIMYENIITEQIKSYDNYSLRS